MVRARGKRRGACSVQLRSLYLVAPSGLLFFPLPFFFSRCVPPLSLSLSFSVCLPFERFLIRVRISPLRSHGTAILQVVCGYSPALWSAVLQRRGRRRAPFTWKGGTRGVSKARRMRERERTRENTRERERERKRTRSTVEKSHIAIS